MKIGKNQKEAIKILNTNNLTGTDINKLSCIMNLHSSEIKRIIKPLENKNLVRNNKVLLFLRNDTKYLNMAKVSTRQEFYLDLRDNNIFTNLTDSILIETDINFYSIFLKAIEENQSLNKLKTTHISLYNKLIKGFLEILNYQVSELQRKLSSWSNNRYQIVIIDHKKIKMVSTTNKKTMILNQSYSKSYMREYKILSECVFLLARTLSELHDCALSIGTKDYSKF